MSEEAPLKPENYQRIGYEIPAKAIPLLDLQPTIGQTSRD